MTTYQSAKVITVFSVTENQCLRSNPVARAPTIVNIIHVRLGIMRVVNDEWTAKTVTVLNAIEKRIPYSSQCDNLLVLLDGSDTNRFYSKYFDFSCVQG